MKTIFIEFNQGVNSTVQELQFDSKEKMLELVHLLRAKENLNKNVGRTLQLGRIDGLLTSELNGGEFFHQFNKVFENEYLLLDKDELIEPKMVVQWSEHFMLPTNTVMNFAEGNELLAKLEKEANRDTEKKVEYYKTKYHLIMPNEAGEVDLITLRTDIGAAEYESPLAQIISEKYCSQSQLSRLQHHLTKVNLKQHVEELVKVIDTHVIGNEQDASNFNKAPLLLSSKKRKVAFQEMER